MELRKVLIVDDEIWIARSLRELIDWETEGFRVAGIYTDPLLAMESIREMEPDLILLDIRMPQLSGQQIMDALQAEGIRSSVILISAYSDFSVARKAIACGAAGYILKPIDGAELLAAVRRVRPAAGAQPADPLDADRILTSAFNGELPEPVEYALALVSPAETGNLFAESGLRAAGPVRIYGNRCIWLLRKEGAANWSAVRERAAACGCSMGVSGVGKLPESYPALYQQALCALYRTILREQCGCYFYQPPDREYVLKWFERLTAASQRQEPSAVQAELGRLMESWKQEGNPGTLSLLTMQLSSWVLQENRFLPNLPLSSQNFFSAFAGLDDVRSYLIEILCGSGRRKAQEFLMAPKVVENIKVYIEEHFSEELTLTELAKRFFLSPSYVSDIFKRSTGCTITAYILKIRMEQAAKLLRSTNAGLVEVADRVGYGDYNYFCRLFKRTFHMSPNTYRRTPADKLDGD